MAEAAGKDGEEEPLCFSFILSSSIERFENIAGDRRQVECNGVMLGPGHVLLTLLDSPSFLRRIDPPSVCETDLPRDEDRISKVCMFDVGLRFLVEVGDILRRRSIRSSE